MHDTLQYLFLSPGYLVKHRMGIFNALPALRVADLAYPLIHHRQQRTHGSRFVHLEMSIIMASRVRDDTDRQTDIQDKHTEIINRQIYILYRHTDINIQTDNN